MTTNTMNAVALPDQPFWDRPIQLKLKPLFAALGKATLAATFQQWDEAVIAGLAVADAAGVTRTPQRLAGALITRALARATFSLLKGYLKDFRTFTKKDRKAIQTLVGGAFSATQVLLDEDFLQRPGDISAVNEFRSRLETWLKKRGIRDQEPATIAARLPTYFVYALHQEFRDGKMDYTPLVQFIKTEVADAWRKERTWEGYRRLFQKSLDEPVFGQSFSLKQISIWPNAYFVRRDASKKGSSSRRAQANAGDGDQAVREESRVVCELKSALDTWLATGHKEDAIRMISGDPGAGKSAFVRMYAEYRMTMGDRVFLAPLHALNVLADLSETVESFCKLDDDSPTGLLDSKEAPSRLLLVLDGLDELSKQGNVGAVIASQFVDEVIRTVQRRNTGGLHLQVLMSGRPIAVQNVADKFRTEGQILYLLPYYTPDDERASVPAGPFRYEGKIELLKNDLRQNWWRSYGSLTGKHYAGLPKGLDRKQLDEVTSQPLLNHLLALVYEGKTIDLTEDVCRNEIYSALLDRVYARDWDHGSRTKGYTGLAGISKSDFNSLLEEMALTAWHDCERSTTVEALRKRCHGTYLQSVLELYKQRSAEGIGQLFTAFYFKKGQAIRGLEPTYEFTHKSFGEYLTSRRIVDAVKEIYERFRGTTGSRSRMGRWNESEALVQWLGVCGPTDISTDLLAYLRNEVRLQAVNEKQDVSGWQQMLIRMLEDCLVHGMPCHRLSGGETHKELVRRARNAEETLLVLHSCCARITGTVSNIAWPGQTSAGDMVNRLRGQRSGGSNVTGLLSLDHLSFADQLFYMVDLYGANLSFSTFTNAALTYANIVQADLRGANLEGADLLWVSTGGTKTTITATKGAAVAALIRSRFCKEMGYALLQPDDIAADEVAALLSRKMLAEMDIDGDSMEWGTVCKIGRRAFQQWAQAYIKGKG